jgi:hypothetical protein
MAIFIHITSQENSYLLILVLFPKYPLFNTKQCAKEWSESGNEQNYENFGATKE